jgi:type I restriction enzyme S subunit
MHGLKELHINKIASVLANYPSVHKAILYGSRAKGNYREGSDIDISLIGDKLDLSLLLRLENELDDLLLPFNMDISIFDKIENQELIEHINRVGIILYEKGIKPGGQSSV